MPCVPLGLRGVCVEVQVHRLWLISCRVCPRTEFLPKEKTRKQPRLTVKERGQRERKGARGKTPINARAALPALAPAGLVRAHARSLAFALIGFLRTANLPGLPAGAPAGCSLPGLLRGRVALVCKDSSMEPSAFLPAHSVIQVGARYPATHPPPEPCSWRVAYPTPHRSPCRRKFGGRHPGNTKENAAAGRGNPGAHSPGVCGMCPQPPLAGSAAHLPRSGACRACTALERVPWTALGACLPRGASAASKRTPQRACEGVEELDSSQAHLWRFIVKATDDFSAMGTESRLSCSPDFVRSIRRYRHCGMRFCASDRLGAAVPKRSGRSAAGDTAQQFLAAQPQASPIPPFPFYSVLLISSLLPLPLPPKPHFSVATPSAK